LFGEGPEKQSLQEQYAEIENLYFFNAVPKTQMQNVLAFFDVAYIGLQKQSLFRFGISPNKIFDYMMAGIPIIQSISAGNDLVKDANCGISVEGENPRQVFDAIKKMQALSAEERKALGKNGQDYVIINHDYRILAKKMLNAMIIQTDIS
jgi:glycosyltransferase involved in cell wall biosynthesis